MSEPAFCYKCDNIVTFCECGKSITTQEDALEYFKKRIAEQDVLLSMPIFEAYDKLKAVAEAASAFRRESPISDLYAKKDRVLVEALAAAGYLKGEGE